MHRWFPWRLVVSRLARSRGFIDPLTLYARLQQFAQPSEVAEPVELLRAGAVFHARGLINSRAIQHNLDWVWPYWVERQFDPADVAFLPRAFSLTHVNLTHRNWTAVGLPGRAALPIVDPRGLLTPFWDSWSIDVWCMDDNGDILLPSRARQAEQWQLMDASLAVHTRTTEASMRLDTEVRMVETETVDVCRLTARGNLPNGGWMIVSARPCNPEGVSFIDHISLGDDRRSWLINDRNRVLFNQSVEQHHASRYHDADVFVHLRERVEQNASRCSVGLATAAALFHVDAGTPRVLHVDIPIDAVARRQNTHSGFSLIARLKTKAGHASHRVDEDASGHALHTDWHRALTGRAMFDVPDAHYRSLYEAAVRTLVLCTPDDTYAGPYTYKRYWYRDAVFIGHGLLCAGLIDRVRHLVDQFPQRQNHAGYYHSQDGEWDANGEVLWLSDRLRQFSGTSLDSALQPSLQAGADWIDTKRLPDYGGQPHQGLFPAGFSAEHLGPNDHYYWDNYWGLAGLESATRLATAWNDERSAKQQEQRARAFRQAIENSLARLPDIPGMPAIPAAPTRRLDAGAIGSVVASYPLQLCAPNDERLLGTLNFLLARCFYKQGFFQDMIHSGINAYLTLHVAQALLRAGDMRYRDLVRTVAVLASPTGHWPEAVHPRTGGGCMGDGHHAWAAAEWIAMMRYCFLREEAAALLIGSGVLPEWLESGKALSFGPAPGVFGLLTVQITPFERASRIEVSWQARWHVSAPAIRVCIPGYESVDIDAGANTNHVICNRGSP